MNITINGKKPTHYCNQCGALWRRLTAEDIPKIGGVPMLADPGWNLVSLSCGRCCDNAPMGEQIVALEPPARSTPEQRDQLADLLTSIGWRCTADAQWSMLQLALPQIAEIVHRRPLADNTSVRNAEAAARPAQEPRGYAVNMHGTEMLVDGRHPFIPLLKGRDGCTVEPLYAGAAVIPPPILCSECSAPACQISAEGKPKCAEHGVKMTLVADAWVPTVASINALPEPLRKYIHALEANCDPGGQVQEIASLREQRDALAVTAAHSLTHEEIAAAVMASGGTMRSLVQHFGAKMKLGGEFYTACGYPPGMPSPHETAPGADGWHAVECIQAPAGTLLELYNIRTGHLDLGRTAPRGFWDSATSVTGYTPKSITHWKLFIPPRALEEDIDG